MAPPDFSHLRTSNAAPSTNDRSILQGILSTIDHRVMEVTTSISQLQAELTDLLQKRQGYSSMVSPLRSLPLDVFGEIFEFACKDDPSFIIKLSQVCRLWRNAAHTTKSELCSTIRLERDMDDDLVDEYIATCISRACTRPMILIFDEDKTSPECREAVYRILGTCRWKSVKWSTYYPETESGWYNSIFDPLMLNSADCLESFTLFDGTEDSSGIWNFQRASCLKTFSLANEEWDQQEISTKTLLLPWTGIASLSLTTFFAPYFDILQHCAANLQECMIKYHNLDNEIERTYPTTQILFPKLRKLHIHSQDPSYITKMIATPAIEEILLYVVAVPQYVSGLINTWWLSSCAPTLKKLSIKGLDDWEDIFPRLPNLRELFIHHMYGFEGEALRALTIQPETDVLLPNLEVFHLTCDHSTEVQSSFVAFARSRWWRKCDDGNMERPCVKLRYAALRDRNPDDRLCCVDDVEELRRQGMDINVLMPSMKDPNYDGPFEDCLQ